MSASSSACSGDSSPGSNSSGSLSSDLSAASSEYTAAKQDPNYFAAVDVWSKYHQVRPVYPSSLFDLIFEYHRRKPSARFDLAADFGSGPGTIVPELLRAFKRVEASGERLLSGCDLPSPPLTLTMSFRALSLRSESLASTCRQNPLATEIWSRACRFPRRSRGRQSLAEG